MNRKIRFFLFIIVSINCYIGNSQVIDSVFFRDQEKKLINLYQSISTSDDNTNQSAEVAFHDSLLKVLSCDGAFFFVFDSLKKVGRVVSDDESLVLYSWNIPQPNGFNNYYCILLYYSKKEKKHFLFDLKELPDFFSQNRQMPANINAWPAALYYKVISVKYKGQVYYTLLGFNFNNILSNIKVIEAIYFNNNNELNFSDGLFLKGNKAQNRLVFEYNERVQMMLDYNTEKKMIIFDHLSPVKPSLEGQYQFYGPDLSYDGLLFIDGKWVFQSDILLGN